MKKLAYTGKYILRWRDLEGNWRRKEYDEWHTVNKALSWLVNNGINRADIAIPYSELKDNLHET